MRSFHLYKITNSVNDKMYIGATLDPKRRWRYHQYAYSSCTKLKRAMDKYGRENFKFEVICIGTEAYILDLEAKAIVAYNTLKSGYNTLPGGNRVNIALEQETKDKISASLKAYYSKNKSYHKGIPVKTRSDDIPVCAFGFWFPNNRTAIKALNINVKTFYKRRAAGTLHLEAKPLKAVVRAVWGSPEMAEKKSQAMKGKNAGESNGMFGKTNTARSVPVSIEGTSYLSISDAVRLTCYTKSQIEKRVKNPKYSDFNYIKGKQYGIGQN